MVDQAIRTLELSVVAKYAFGLAQVFNAFYHRYSIINEERADASVWRAAAVAYYRAQLTSALELMGCTVPARCSRQYAAAKQKRMKPTIGVTRVQPPRRLRPSIERAGGGRACSRSARVRASVLDEIDGVLLTGGGDVDPGALRRGAAPDDRRRRARAATSSRSTLARRAMARDMPLLAICRGAQVLNVAAGGTLVQDIPSP